MLCTKGVIEYFPRCIFWGLQIEAFGKRATFVAKGLLQERRKKSAQESCIVEIASNSVRLASFALDLRAIVNNKGRALGCESSSAL